MRIAFILALLMLSHNDVSAHGGGLDKNGCHHNRKTGDYHCHNGSSPPRAQQIQQLIPTKSNRPFANCAEARAAGAAPVRRGDPGYGAHLDRDNDGVGCEPYKGK